MSHVVILFDGFGNPYEYYPPHDGEPGGNGGGGNRTAPMLYPSVIAFCETDKIKLKDKDIRPQSEIPPELLETLEAMFG